MLKIWWIWKIEIWSEELVDGYQTVPYQPGALFGGGLLSGSVSKWIHFNPNNSLSILLQISLVFMFTPALNELSLNKFNNCFRSFLNNRENSGYEFFLFDLLIL